MNAPFDFHALETPLREKPIFPVEPRDRDPATEVVRQMKFRNLLRFCSPSIESWSVPNAAKRGPKATAQAKREGLTAGVFDEHYAGPDRWLAFLEWKDCDGTLTQDQIDWGNAMHRRGFRVACVRSHAFALSLFRQWGAPIL